MHKFANKVRKVCAQKTYLFTGALFVTEPSGEVREFSARFTSLLPTFFTGTFCNFNQLVCGFTQFPQALLLKLLINKLVEV